METLGIFVYIWLLNGVVALALMVIKHGKDVGDDFTYGQKAFYIGMVLFGFISLAAILKNISYRK